MSKANN